MQHPYEHATHRKRRCGVWYRTERGTHRSKTTKNTCFGHQTTATTPNTSSSDRIRPRTQTDGDSRLPLRVRGVGLASGIGTTTTQPCATWLVFCQQNIGSEDGQKPKVPYVLYVKNRKNEDGVEFCAYKKHAPQFPQLGRCWCMLHASHQTIVLLLCAIPPRRFFKLF